MTIVMPDTTEMIKDGVLTPVGIQFLSSIIDAQNGLAAAGLTDEQVAILAALVVASLSASGALEPVTSAFLDNDGSQRTAYVDLFNKLVAGTATNAEIQEALYKTISLVQVNYNHIKSIVTRLNEVEAALSTTNLVGQS